METCVDYQLSRTLAFSSSSGATRVRSGSSCGRETALPDFHQSGPQFVSSRDGLKVCGTRVASG